jgi:hypothetical protein
MHIRGFWRAHDMTHLVERRFDKFLRDFRLQTQELRQRRFDYCILLAAKKDGAQPEHISQ